MSAYRIIAVLALFLVWHTNISSARPNDPPGNSSGPGERKALILSEVWGEQIRTPVSCARVIVNLREALTKWTNITAEVGSRRMLGAPGIADMPVIILITDQAFELTDMEKQNLRAYIKSGGFLVLDNILTSQPRNQADAAFRKMIADLFGEGKVHPIPNNHEIYHSWFDLDGPPPGAMPDPSSQVTQPPVSESAPVDIQKIQMSRRMDVPSFTLDGVWVSGRLAGVLSNRGYGLKWSAAIDNDPQLKMGVNFIVYALMQRAEKEGNR